MTQVLGFSIANNNIDDPLITMTYPKALELPRSKSVQYESVIKVIRIVTEASPKSNSTYPNLT